MADNAEKCTPCVKKKVDALIANTDSRWAETDREWLETLSEEQLGKLEPQVVEKEKRVETTVNALSAEDREIIDYVKLQKKENRKNAIAQIKANAEANTWTDEELNAMSDVTLKKIADMVKKEQPGNYSLYGAGNEVNINSIDEEPMAPTGIEFDK